MGWLLDAPSLKSISPSFVPMMPNSAVGIVAAGASVLAFKAGHTHAARALAIFVTALGLITLAEHALGWNAGIDRVLFGPDLGTDGTSTPGRPPPSTALAFVGLGCAVLMLGSRRRRINLAHGVSFAVASIGVMSLTGYLYGVSAFEGPINYSPMAVHTGVACILLGVAIVYTETETGFTRVFLSKGLGGLVARRLLPVVTIFPIVVGLVRVLGERAGLYPTAFGVTLVTIVSVIVLVILVMSIAVTIDRLDAERDRANADLALLNRAQRHFVAGASHELRTPLTSIMGYLELVEESGDLTTEQRDALRVVDRNTTRLYRLVDSLLQMLRRGERSSETTSLEMATLAQEAVESAKLLAESREVELLLDVRDRGAIRGDSEQLSQALDNLISNALKFSRSGGRVTVTVDKVDGFVSCAVRDSGIGISQSDQERLFDTFFRAQDAKDKGIEGSGLGLSITRTIIEKHGGEVSVSSQVGHGSTFSIRLPGAAATRPIDE
ncbi:MAG: HAMP domain-containing histidine kinase [Actinomycetota bacterium]|nr:HAMP domain-containing histidine kinase [Actinomycetota bacterium]